MEIPSLFTFSVNKSIDCCFDRVPLERNVIIGTVWQPVLRYSRYHNACSDVTRIHGRHVPLLSFRNRKYARADSQTAPIAGCLIYLIERMLDFPLDFWRVDVYHSCSSWKRWIFSLISFSSVNDSPTTNRRSAAG